MINNHSGAMAPAFNEVNMIDITKPLMFKGSMHGYKFNRLIGTMTDGSVVVEAEYSYAFKPVALLFNSDGKLYGDMDGIVRLINVPEHPMEFWINVYANNVYSPHVSKENADLYATGNRSKCIHVIEVK